MITSTSNQKIKDLKELNTKQKARRKLGAFVVEGERAVLEVPSELLIMVYAAESFDSEKLKGFPQDKIEILSDNVFKSVCDTQTPQGVMAVVKMPHYELKDLLEGENTNLLILENVQDPGNLGTMMRTGEGAGITGVVMSKGTVELFNPKTVRATMGSIYRVPFYVAEDLAETIDEIKKNGVKLYAAHLKGKVFYDEVSYKGPTGFLIGNEGNGLTDETADMADTYIKIPMAGELESLNAAMAAGILMYEANRQRRKI